MHSSEVKVTRGRHVFSGRRGQLSIDGDQVSITFEDGADPISFDGANVKRASCNEINGLWAFRFKDGGKLFMQSAGVMLAADRTDAGRETNRLLRELLKRHGVRALPF